MHPSDNLEDERKIWEIHREKWLRQGYDLKVTIPKWVDEQKQQLAFAGARKDFTELCRSGCGGHVLAGITALMGRATDLEDLWVRVVGEPNVRRRSAKLLESAALTIEERFRGAETPGVAEIWKYLEASGHVAPGRLISELRFYSEALFFVENLLKNTQVRSLLDVSKYLLTSYIKLATGRWRDRNSSSLIAEIVGPDDYNEVAHRMWRKRNYSRLDVHFSGLSKLLFAMGSVMDFRT